MNTKRLSYFYFGALFAIVIFLVSACQPVAVAATADPTQPPAQPSATPVILATQTAQPTQTPPVTTGEIVLDLSGVAQNQTGETVAAEPASAGGPYWEAAPQYQRVTLQGYPVTSHLMKPQISVYPVADLAGFNENAGRMAADLQALLQTRQSGDHLPFLPLFNAQQVFHAQVQYLNFQNGKGVRFLTQFDQAPLPINNYELIYTFQGLTSDGKYYIAAVLPVTHPELPANQQVSAQQATEMNNFPGYLTKTVTLMDQQPKGSFTPDLAKLDAMIQSIEIQ